MECTGLGDGATLICRSSGVARLRRAGLARQSPARKPGQRRHRRRLDQVRLNSATHRGCARMRDMRVGGELEVRDSATERDHLLRSSGQCVRDSA